jgi:4-oxalocrotonate tautomerase
MVLKGAIVSKYKECRSDLRLRQTASWCRGENMRNVTWCVVEEVESGGWGIGGNALSTADVHALARGKAA